jgi:probable HAF family extracellular repeat protein
MGTGISSLYGGYRAGIVGLVFGLLLSGVLAQQYVVRNLGTLGGNYSVAYGVNNAGQVVGASTWQPGQIHAFRTQPNSPINPQTDRLGTLGGSEAYALAINDAGQVVGFSLLSDNTTIRGFLAEPDGTLIALGTLGGSYSYALALNEFGDVVGASLLSDNETLHAFVKFYGQQMRDIGDLGGGESIATGINRDGLVVGYSALTTGLTHAFIWSAYGGIQDIDGRDTRQSFATAISNAGVVVGYATFDDYAGFRAFKWTQGEGFTMLESYYGTIESRAMGVNSRGVIVGWFQDEEGTQRACAWFPNVGIVDLNNLLPPNTPWRLLEATAVNDADQIVGYGLFNGEPRAFLMEVGVVPGDVNGDGCVDDADLLTVLFAFGCSTGCGVEDINGDGVVDDADLLEVLFNFGSGC